VVGDLLNELRRRGDHPLGLGHNPWKGRDDHAHALMLLQLHGLKGLMTPFSKIASMTFAISPSCPRAQPTPSFYRTPVAVVPSPARL